MSQTPEATDLQISTSNQSNNRRRSIFYEENAKLVPKLQVKDVRNKNSDGHSNEGTETEITKKVVSGALAKLNNFHFIFSCSAWFIIATLVLTGVLQKIFKDENMGIFRALTGLVFALFFHIPEIKGYFSVPEKVEASDNLNNDIKNLPLFTKSGDKFIDYQRKLYRLGVQKDLELASSDPVRRAENLRRISLNSDPSDEKAKERHLDRIRRASMRRASIPGNIINNISLSSVIDGIDPGRKNSIHENE
ncbi:unnamed protein product [Oikopleura dioica]|uniref:Uncharacterized protein n=1 Tax=Oikopleura dioica TaxID=34765 RepID=E4XPD8_OIKDI|nr:unnamed protein product [Oikopleura dioica]